VEHGFNVELEKVRSELRSRESQITALTANVLSGKAAREAALSQRKLNAAAVLWEETVKMAQFRGAAFSMSTLNLLTAAERAQNEHKVRQFFSILAQNYDLSKMSFGAADSTRPFLTELAWAYFSALRAICAISVTYLKLLELGEDPTKLVNNDLVANLVKSALPSHSAYIEEHGASAYSHLIEPLETLLLFELRRIIEGKEQDRDALVDAAEIIKTAGGVMATTVEVAADAGLGPDGRKS
jgi:hypothetical protein